MTTTTSSSPGPLLSTSTILTCIAIFLPIILFLAMPFWRKPQFSPSGRTILITGGSQGLGLSLATKLSARGANVAIVARDEAKLSSALSQIRSAGAASAAAASKQDNDTTTKTQQRFLSLSYDLTHPESAREILAKVTEWNNGSPPDVVWCCAGYCIPSFFADADIETLRSQMDTLYWSCAYMAHATLNLWKRPAAGDAAQGKGATAKPTKGKPQTRHLIFTSSALAFFPVAGYAPYTPAKSAMRSLADTLQQEVAVWNAARSSTPTSSSTSANTSTTAPPPFEIQIHTAFPMGITSPNFDKENTLKPAVTKLLEKDDQPQSPDDVADAAIRGLERGETMIVTSLLGALMKGAGMGSSLRQGLGDVLWNFLGSAVVYFVGWDFWGKAQKWGKEKGMATGP